MMMTQFWKIILITNLTLILSVKADSTNRIGSRNRTISINNIDKEIRRILLRKRLIRTKIEEAIKDRVDLGHHKVKSNNDDAETLADIFEDDMGDFSSDTLEERLYALFDITVKTEFDFGIVKFTGYAPGLHVDNPIIGDNGYKEIFRDRSKGQTGHFLTALRLAIEPGFLSREVAYIDLPFMRNMGTVREMIERKYPYARNMSDEEIGIRMSIGHEKFPDPFTPHALFRGQFYPPNVLLKHFSMATAEEVKNFKLCLEAFGDRDKMDLKAARKYFYKLNVKNEYVKNGIYWNFGNSEADMWLTLAGYKLGEKILSGEIATRHELARWVRINLKANN